MLSAVAKEIFSAQATRAQSERDFMNEVRLKNCRMLNFWILLWKWDFWILMMFIPDYHLQFTFEYQIRFQSVSSGIKTLKNIGSS